MRFAPISGFLLSAILAACGTVRDRGACVVTSDCPSGQYCVTTADRGACVADTAPPTVSGVSVTCAEPAGAGTTCLRDGVLRVQATVTDDREVAGAEASFDVGGSPVPLARTAGNVWSADVRLAKLPFGYFEHAVLTTVTAHDSAGNGAAAGAAGGGVAVTRRRFARTLDTGVVVLGSPTVMNDGTVTVAATTGNTVYFVPWDGNFATSVVHVGTAGISAAPLVLGQSLWIGSEDNKLYEVARTLTGWEPTARCDTTRPVRGSLASAANGFVIAASGTGRLYSAKQGVSSCAGNSGKSGAFSLGPVIDYDGGVYAVAGNVVRRLLLDEFGVPDDDPSFIATTLPREVFEPLAANSALYVATRLGTQGALCRVSVVNAAAEQIAATPAPSGGVVILSDGGIVVPDASASLSKWAPRAGASSIWRTSEMNGVPRTPLVLTGTAQLVASTDAGTVYAIRPDGTIAWSAQLSAGTASLQPGNIYTPPGQPAGEELSTAYFAGADGVLHAVIVDGKLDAAAPWPKVFHDPQNTNRAGAQP